MPFRHRRAGEQGMQGPARAPSRVPAFSTPARPESNALCRRQSAEGEPSAMEAKTIGLDRRQFLSGVSVAAIAGITFGVLPHESEQGAALWTGTILHAADGQRIPLAGRCGLTIKVDSQLTPGVRMPMVTEDLPPGVPDSSLPVRHPRTSGTRSTRFHRIQPNRPWRATCSYLLHARRRSTICLHPEKREPSDRHYVDRTSDVDNRLAWHITGPSGYTRNHRPWPVIVPLEFPIESHAAGFERYLKSGSGRAFARRHL